MRPQSPALARAAARPYASPRLLLQIDFTAPAALTLRLADQHFPSLLGHEWLPMVAAWGTLEDAINTVDAGGRPATVEGLSFFNRTPIAGRERMSDLIRTRFNPQGYEWAFARMTVREVLDPTHGLGDEQPLGVFFLEDPTEIGEDLLVVRATDWSQALGRKLKITRVTRDDFSSCAASAIGRDIPRPFGVLKKVEAIPLVAGVASRLASDLTSGATSSLSVEDNSAFPTSGKVMIDQEIIAYASKSGTQQLDTLTRGSEGTTAAAHTAPATVNEIRTGTNTYRFIVGESIGNHKIKSISNILVNGHSPRTSPTTTLDETGLVSGKSFATINFTPSNVKNFHTLRAAGNQETASPGTITTSPAVSEGQNGSASATISATGGAEILKVVRAMTGKIEIAGGTIDGAHPVPWSVRRRLSSGTDVVVASGSATQSTFPIVVTHTAEYESTESEVVSLTVTGAQGTSSLQLKMTFSSYTITYDFGEGDASGDSTAEVVIGEVTCDVEGLKDDASGSISGTASVLLENPSDITKLILTQLFPGVGTADLGTTWPTTRVRHATVGLKWATLLEFMEFAKLRRKLGEQARSLLFFDGDRWQWKYLEDTPAAEMTLDYLNDVDAAESATPSRTPRTEIRNQVFVYSQRDYSKRGGLEDIYQRVKTHQDLTQPGLTDPLPYDLELDWVQDAATADNLGAFWLAQWKRQRFEIALVADWNVLALEKADYVKLENHPLLSGHGGPNLVFRIVSKRHLGDGGIALHLVEANT